MKYTLYTYDLWADQTVCADCGEPKNDDPAHKGCEGGELTTYFVNDVFKNETVEAEKLDQAIAKMGLKLDVIEEDSNVDNSAGTVYFRYKSGQYSGSPACEIREEK